MDELEPLPGSDFPPSDEEPTPEPPPPDERAEPGPPEVEAPEPVPGTGVFRCVLDVATGEERDVELTEAEVLEARAWQDGRAAVAAEREAAAAAELEAKAAAREPDLAIVREAALTDPKFAALLRVLGVEEEKP